jgi:prepilin-type N-terminal cleavage/methylation domain-containing protein
MSFAMRDQKGVTLLEVLLAIIVISLTVTAMIKSLDQDLKGQARLRNDLRAATLVRSKLDTLKDYSRTVALSGYFSSVTLSPVVAAYAVSTPALVDNKAFTWIVKSSFVTMTSPAAIYDVTWTTKAVRYIATVTWVEQRFAKYLTQTVVVSDPSQ